MATLSDVLSSIAAFINQDSDISNLTDTEASMWTNLVNQSQNEWSDMFAFRKQMTKPYTPTVSAAQTSIGLPANFIRLMSPVFDYSTGRDAPTRYYEIIPEERFLKISTEKYVYKLGDELTGYSLQINPALSSGASICMDYQAAPTALATYTDLVTCPSTQFIVTRTLSKILMSRSDPRYTALKTESDTLLASMQSEEAAPTQGMNNVMRSRYERAGFRVGEQ